MRAVVTAGGTSEPVDDVRVITNLSTGRFGAAIASALARKGIEVTLLAGKALASHPEWVDDRVTIVPFGSTADLDRALSAAIDPPPELLFMAAAVSDYTPVRAQGKIRSDQDELVIQLTRNPKLLGTLRDRCGIGTFLVGFKLLSGVPAEELQQTARRQVQRDHLNLCVANDLQELSKGEHPVWLVTPEGGALRRTGSKAEVAEQLVDFVLRRRAVRWHSSVQLPGAPPLDEGHAAASALLSLAIDAGLLPGTDGNVSYRGAGPGALWSTPRQVRKSELKPEDLALARVDPATRRVSWQGTRKPSIDTAVHAWLYRQLPSLMGLLHFHEALVVPTATTAFPYPCGTLEEAAEIGEALSRAAWEGRWDGGAFSVKLVDHGYLVGVTDAAGLVAQWQETLKGYQAHLEEIGAAGAAVPGYSPVFDGGRIVGVSARFDAGELVAWSTWLRPEVRGGGLGDSVIEALAALGRHAVVADRCEVLDYYAERGWKLRARQSPYAVLTPPTRRDDLVPAASVCLLDPVRRAVLLGRRRTDPWAGYWSFPGGRVEGQESSLSAALRELTEETAIRLEEARSLRERLVFVGGERGFAVTNHVVAVLGAPEPKPSAELEARWVPLSEAGSLKPMAAGTRRVLRELARDLARSEQR